MALPKVSRIIDKLGFIVVGIWVHSMINTFRAYNNNTISIIVVPLKELRRELKRIPTIPLKELRRELKRIPTIMTHRKVRIRDKNAYLTLVPSESSRQADSGSMSHS